LFILRVTRRLGLVPGELKKFVVLSKEEGNNLIY